MIAYAYPARHGLEHNYIASTLLAPIHHLNQSDGEAAALRALEHCKAN